MPSKEIKVGYLARVEGEGSLYIKYDRQKVEEVKLKIFEPPRFFEGFLQGKPHTEAPDITARICGICPVAYQMSAVHAMEAALGIEVDERVQQLRRLIYAGEWIESHTLHIYMLHAPDFLRYHDAIAMAEDHKAAVTRGLRMKKIGNKIIQVLGGREVHPINVRVGGFYRLPKKSELLELKDELEWAIEAAKETVDWVAGFDFPDFEVDYNLVSLFHNDEYPMNRGTIRSSDGLEISSDEYEDHFIETHVPHSTALHCLQKNGEPYLTGPLARFALAFQQLPKVCQDLAKKVGIGPDLRNPYKSIVVRSIEVVYAFVEALRIIEEYEEFADQQPVQKRQGGRGTSLTEAPRGSLFHRYDIDDNGKIKTAKIVPPTSQNQARIERDLFELIPKFQGLSDEELTHRCEQTIRNYDPCISCSTHFLKLQVDRGES